MSITQVLAIAELRVLMFLPHFSHEEVVRLSRCCRALHSAFHVFLLHLAKRRAAALRLQWWWRQFTTPFTSSAQFTLIIGSTGSGRRMTSSNLGRLGNRGRRLGCHSALGSGVVEVPETLRTLWLLPNKSVIIDCHTAASIGEPFVGKCDKLLICDRISDSTGRLLDVARFSLFRSFMAACDLGSAPNKELFGGGPFRVLELSAAERAWKLFDMQCHPALIFAEQIVFPNAKICDRPRLLGRGILKL